MKKGLPINLILLLLILSGSVFSQGINIAISSTNVTCFGGSDGSANASVSGGTPPYSYSWIPGGYTTASVSGLAPGTYTVTVMDALAADTLKTITITQPGAISLNAGLDGTICQGSSYPISAACSGGTPPYTYNWSPSSGLSSSTVLSPVASPISTTMYTVTAIDMNGCTVSDNIVITVNPLPSITISASPMNICVGSNSTLTAAGASAYNWNTGATTSQIVVSPATSTTYTVTGTNAAGCVNSATVNVFVSTVPTVNLSGVNPTCSGMSNGSVNSSVGGGTPPYSYSWSNTATTANLLNIPAGSYALTVVDANGCSNNNSYVLTEPSTISTTMIPSDITCNGVCNGQAEVIASGGVGGYVYNWIPTGGSSSIAFGLCAGSYTCNITDANGCTTSANTNIIEPSALAIIPTSISVTCYGSNNGSANVVALGGVPPYLYNWSNGATSSTINNLGAGSYNVDIVDANGCIVSDSFAITSPSLLNNSFSISPPSCGTNDGSVSSNVSGGTPPYSYLWSSGNTSSSLSSLGTGIYMLDVTDNNGCVLSDIAMIGSSSGPVVTQTSFSNITCNGADDGMVSVSISGGTAPYTVFWTDMDSTYITQTRTNMQPGPYEFIVSDANGCQTVFNTYINEPAAINVEFSYTMPSSCISGDGSISAVVTGGSGLYTYLWSPGGTTTSSLSGVLAGVYTLTVVDANGCLVTKEAMLSDNTSLDAVGSSQVTSCGTNTGSVDISTLNGSGMYSYNWSNGASTEDISNLYPGNYAVTITDDGTGCKKALNFVVESTTASYAPEVCLVTVDTVDERNIIVWERPSIGGIKEFVIYRETSQPGVYRYIGTNPIDSLTEMKDTIANADLHAWKYKISAIDSCGVETGVSEVEHRPIYLTVDTNGVGLPSLMWTHYMGRPYSGYVVKRNVNGAGWEDVVTLPSTQTTFEDLNCPSGSIEYSIEALFTSTCTSSRGAINTTRSNIKSPSSVIVGLKANGTIANNISLFPNPSQDNFTVSLTNKVKENVNIEVVNALGQVVYTTIINESSKATTINAASWNNGVYFVRLNSTEINSVIKFVKQ